MSVLLFIAMLLILVVGHEFGHLVAAKAVGMRVLEFGIGFPPKLWSRPVGGTEYSVNALPFGGFVRIFGEDATEASNDARAFSNKPAFAQAVVIFAGPFTNILLAFVFSTMALLLGVTTVIDPEEGGAVPPDARVVVLNVLPDSPAHDAGIMRGDAVVAIAEKGVVQEIKALGDIIPAVQESSGALVVSVIRAKESLSFEVVPRTGIIEESPETLAIGLGTAFVGTLRLPFLSAVAEGFTRTIDNTIAVTLGIAGLIVQAFSLSADLTNVAGPVGIARLTGDAASYGAGSVLLFAAFISINLGIINLLPFPALDGGRLALLGAEAITRRKVPLSVANAINTAGFAILIILMILVTAQDVARLIS